ncbi:tRNA dimethylallyltransferase [Pedobacter psychrotolerans]|uniref:tRNA dimethylallyltransferase n=1 Tax=Pedobacter psychrotolerans TaxID=1843235 RepID=A0A4R2HBT1_9SPHI|nr:tRNA (adenosine(37)-N6)-dimethylallyltransferase MiaA [Pedobacter psychrotolerans]TCO25108.1 tRNA dimethylallyltransferase [Pedobacter psychrotolerans]GGE48053.1 tRNA dimethylallyltransferase 2 [Pedobacter psychrotolerans]
MADYNLIIILGATASGKTKLAVQLADKLNGEIISADSRQIFRKMDIGTGKDLHEYDINNRTIPYHLIDILDPGERYHVDAFKNDFYAAFESIIHRNKVPILCGGTGMYIHSLLQNQKYTAVPVDIHLREELDLLEKEQLILKLKAYPLEEVIHVDKSSKKRLIRAIEIAEFLQNHEVEDENRPLIKPIVFGLKNEVELTRSKILSRLHYRLENGMIEEVASLITSGVSKEMLVYYGLEYKFIVNYLNGQLTYDELKLRLGIAICQYAKRQNTFFRKMEKDQVNINWLNAAMPTSFLIQQMIKKIMAKS